MLIPPHASLLLRDSASGVWASRKINAVGVQGLSPAGSATVCDPPLHTAGMSSAALVLSAHGLIWSLRPFQREMLFLFSDEDTEAQRRHSSRDQKGVGI